VQAKARGHASDLTSDGQAVDGSSLSVSTIHFDDRRKLSVYI
jgi:hypothetical protein